MSTQPFFSIIIPAYNAEMFIGECIDSVLSQSFGDFEVVLVDDGSSDNTGLIADSYAKSSEITVLHIANSGAAAARNVGIRHARGLYVTFLDVDDKIERTYLENLQKAIVSSLANVYLGSCRVDLNEHVTREVSLYDFNLVNKLPFEEKIDYLFNAADDVPVACWHNVMALSFLNSEKLLFDENMVLSEDRDFLLRILMRKPSVVAIDVTGYIHRIGLKSSVTGSKSLEKYEKELSFNLKWLEVSNSNEMLRAISNWFIGNYFRCLRKIAEFYPADFGEREAQYAELIAPYAHLSCMAKINQWLISIKMTPRVFICSSGTVSRFDRVLRKTLWFLNYRLRRIDSAIRSIGF